MTKADFIEQTTVAFIQRGLGIEEAWDKAIEAAEKRPNQKIGPWEARRATQSTAHPQAGATNGPVFPNFGATKGMPVMGAKERDLRYYAHAAVRTLKDPSKERWHGKERDQLAAYVSEMKRQGFDASEFEQDEGADDPPGNPVGPAPDDSDGSIPF